MSVQETLQSAMYQDIDALTAVIRRMQLHRGVCRSDGIALEAHIVLPTSLRQYTESPSRTHYDRTLAIAKAKRANLHHDLYAMESHAVLSRPDLSLTELCASMEAITGRHFLMFGGVLALIAILLKFFGVDGGSGGGGGGGGGGGSVLATKAAAAVEVDLVAIQTFAADTEAVLPPKATESTPIVTTANPTTGANTTTAHPHLQTPNMAASVVVAQTLGHRIVSLLPKDTPPDVINQIIKSPKTMRDWLLANDGRAFKEAIVTHFMGNSFFKIDKLSDTEQDNYITFYNKLDDHIARHHGNIKIVLDGVVAGKAFNLEDLQKLGFDDEYIPKYVLDQSTASTHNATIAHCKQSVVEAERELDIAPTIPRMAECNKRFAALLAAYGHKCKEVYFDTAVYTLDLDNFNAEVEKVLLEPMDTYMDLLKHQESTVMPLIKELQSALTKANTFLDERRETYNNSASGGGGVSQDELAENMTLIFVNSTLRFALDTYFSMTKLMHAKTQACVRLSSYLHTYRAAVVDIKKLYDTLE